MPNINGYLDFILNPALKNFQLENLSNNIIPNQQPENSKQIEEQFLEVLDNAMDLVDIPEFTSEKSSNMKNEDKNDENKESDFNPIFSQNFGPPLGIEIENFNYSLI